MIISKTNLMLLGALALSVVSPALIADVAARVNEPQNISTSAIPGERTDSSLFVTAGPGLATYNGNIGWSINFGVLSQLGGNRNLFYGLDGAINFWSFSSNSAPVAQFSSGATGIQLLPTMVYRFEVSMPWLFPYIGLSVGPNIYREKQTVSGNTDTKSDVFLEVLFRPGFFTKLTKTVSLQVEPKFGILRSEFIFLPQANAVFAL